MLSFKAGNSDNKSDSLEDSKLLSNVIAVISHRVPYPPNKGEKIRTYYQIEHLVRAGFDVTVFCPLETEVDLQYSKELENVLGVKVVGEKLPSKPYRLIKGILSNQALSVANFYSPPLHKKVTSFVNSVKPRVILLTASSLLPYSDELSHQGMLKLMDFMDVDSDKWLQYAQKSVFPMSLLYRREHHKIKELEQSAAAYFDECYLIAQSEVNLFKKTISDTEKVKVLGNGLDTTTFYPATEHQDESPPVLLFTGVMDYKPNVDAVVWFVDNCWPAIRSTYPKSRFIIAGMNPDESVQKLANREGVEVTGFVEDILGYFHQSNVFVAPFRLARGVQNKVLQAFACALPVVSTSMGAEGIDCKDETHLLIADSPEDFIQLLIRLIENRPLAEQLGDNALSLIREKYSWEGQLAPLTALLHKSD